MTKKTGGELLSEQLMSQRVDTVFGVPGVQLDYAVDGLAQHTDSIDFISARHEQGAAYMADGYARVNGAPGVFMVVPGPGLLNAGAALSTAFASNSPVVCISGQIPSHTIGKGLGMLHEIRGQSEVLRSLTKWSAIATSPEQIPELVREAFKQAQSGRPGPVGLEVPPDVLQATTTASALAPSEPALLEPDPASICRAAALIAAADRPVILAGGGVRTAASSEALRSLAERIGAPVVKTRNGKGALSDRHPLALSRLAGRRVLAEADLILAIGTRFVTLAGQPVARRGDQKLIALNADVADIGAPREFDEAIVADAKLGMEALSAELPQQNNAPDLERARADERSALAHIAPQAAWLTAIRTALPDDGILVEELTQVGYAARLAYPIYETGTYVTPGYQGTLGYGFPTALGAKVGAGGRQVVSITGDGGFGWSLQELSTAVKYGIGLTTVVFNNGTFGNVQRIQSDTFGRNLGVDLHNPDFKTLCSAFGVDYEHAGDPESLGGSIRNAAGSGRPLLIEVPIGDVPDPWRLIFEPTVQATRDSENKA